MQSIGCQWEIKSEFMKQNKNSTKRWGARSFGLEPFEAIVMQRRKCFSPTIFVRV